VLSQKKEWYNHVVNLHERDGSVSSEASVPLESSGVVFGRDYSSLLAEFIGTHSGAPFTEQKQLDLYRTLRLRDQRDSDQVIYARVLAQTGGLVDDFKAKYPHILFPSGLELENF